MHTTHEKKPQRTWELAFGMITAMLVAVGVLAQCLCEQLGETPFLKEYLFHLLPAFGIFFLHYLIGIGTHSRKWFVKLVSWVPVLVMLFFLFLVGCGIVYALEEESEAGRNERQLDRMAIHYLLERAKPFGQGKPCYKYPDSVLEGYEASFVGLPQDVYHAFQEREMAKYYFKDYRSHTMLPVLSYSYGLWVNWLYVSLTATWCILGGIVCLRLFRGWDRLIYMFPYGAVAYQMINALLYGYGKNVFWSLYPFCGNPWSNLLFVAPLLGLMFGLVKSSRPKLSMLMVLERSSGEIFSRRIENGSETP